MTNRYSSHGSTQHQYTRFRGPQTQTEVPEHSDDTTKRNDKKAPKRTRGKKKKNHPKTEPDFKVLHLSESGF